MAPPDASATPHPGGTPASPARPPAPVLRAPRPLPLRPLSSPSYRPPRRLGRAIGTLGGCVLGGILLAAVWGKALDPAAFAEQIHADGLDRLLPAGVLALLALALEAGIGLALLLAVRRLWVLVPASLLVVFFLLLNGRAYWLAAHGQASAATSCGCFGNLVQRTPAEAFWQDLALLALPLALAFVGRDREQPRLPPLRTALVALFAIAVPVFAWRAPELPLDNLATRLAPGATMSTLCAGGGSGGGGGRGGGGGGGAAGGSAAGARAGAVCLDTVAPELDHGNHLVVLDDIDDPALARAVAGLNAYADAPGAAAVWVLTASEAKRQRLFFWRWGPTFKIVEAPPELLRPLYRRLPRSFAVQDGRVTSTFSGLPPLPRRTAGASGGATPGNPSARPHA
ncbi:MAG TPA: MauE/DoxX family redox-associated membrane protein [Thermoanaerobaculia bacterium]|nr:MauE/DoxX family redox-associated membrane protein [Thermoanaerobaculia bacterium]